MTVRAYNRETGLLELSFTHKKESNALRDAEAWTKLGYAVFIEDLGRTRLYGQIQSDTRATTFYVGQVADMGHQQQAVCGA